MTRLFWISCQSWWSYECETISLMMILLSFAIFNSTSMLKVTIASVSMHNIFHVANISILLSIVHIIVSRLQSNLSSMNEEMKIWFSIWILCFIAAWLFHAWHIVLRDVMSRAYCHLTSYESSSSRCPKIRRLIHFMSIVIDVSFRILFMISYISEFLAR